MHADVFKGKSIFSHTGFMTLQGQAKWVIS
jgi:hypothetical protein